MKIRICCLLELSHCQDWRRRHKTRGFRDKKGFLWRRHGTPDEIPHQRSPKLKLRVKETFANDLSNGECLRPALLQDISSQSLPLIEASTIQQDRESLDKSLTSVSVSSNKIETDDDILHNDNGIIVNRYQHVNLQWPILWWPNISKVFIIFTIFYPWMFDIPIRGQDVNQSIQHYVKTVAQVKKLGRGNIQRENVCCVFSLWWKLCTQRWDK